jgi:uncharacterized protein YecT (DUF1311 family)
MPRLLVLLIPLLATPAHAAGATWCDQPQVHPIDADFVAAIERSGGVTVDMRDAQVLTYDSWDAELNRLYRTLMRQLGDSVRRDALRKAQRAWLAWDAAEADSDLAMQEDNGSAGPLIIADQAIDRRRARACTLYRLQPATSP